MKFRTLSDTLCISRQALLACVNEKNVDMSVNRKRLRAVLPGWYAWASVPKRWRGDIEAHWCGGESAELWWSEQSVASQLKEMLPPAHPEDVLALLGERVERGRVSVVTGEQWGEVRGGLPQADRQALVEATRWLRLLLELDSRACRGHFGLSRKALIERHLIPLLAQEEVKLPGSYRRLLAKADEYKRQGAGALKPGYYGNSNATKIGDEQVSLLVTLYCDPTKPTIDGVWNMYNELAASMEWAEVSLRSVRRHLRRPEVAQLWTLGREGMAEWRRAYGYTFWTQRATMPDLLWVIDGTKVNYFYRDAQGRRAARLNVVLVIDAHSYYILGWHFSTSAETTEMVRAASREAVRTADGRFPMQYLSDNSSANASFFQDWPTTHTAAQPHRGQAKPIEAMFGQLQQYIMRRNPFFTGQNITAKGQRGKLNVDAIPPVSELLSLDEVMHEAALDFEIWNQSPRKALGGKTPAEAYEQGDRIETLRLSPEIERECFWTWHCDQRGQRYRKRVEGTILGMTLGGTRYQYEVLDAKGELDAQFYRLHQGTEFEVKYDLEDPTKGLALYLPNGDRYLTLATEQYRAPRALGDRQEGDGARISERLDWQRAQIERQKAEVAGMMQHMDEEMDAEEKEKLGYLHVSKEVISRAEEALRLRESGEPAAAPDAEEETISTTPPARPKPSAMDLIKSLDEHYND